MSKDPNWNAVRDRALQIERTGIKYDTAWQMAEREILHSPSRGRTTQMANEQAANRLNIAADKIAARDELHKLAHDRQDRLGGNDYQPHWAAVTSDPANSQLVTRMNAALPAGAESDLSMSGGSQPASNVCPVCSPRHAAIFGLRTDLPQDEFGAAFTANGNTMSPVDHAAILDGLAAHIAQRDGIGRSTAENQVKAKNPQLAQILQVI